MHKTIITLQNDNDIVLDLLMVVRELIVFQPFGGFRYDGRRHNRRITCTNILN